MGELMTAISLITIVGGSYLLGVYSGEALERRKWKWLAKHIKDTSHET